jgi:hypothetical protein
MNIETYVFAIIIAIIALLLMIVLVIVRCWRNDVNNRKMVSHDLVMDFLTKQAYNASTLEEYETYL